MTANTHLSVQDREDPKLEAIDELVTHSNLPRLNCTLRPVASAGNIAISGVSQTPRRVIVIEGEQSWHIGFPLE